MPLDERPSLRSSLGARCGDAKTRAGAERGFENPEGVTDDDGCPLRAGLDRPPADTRLEHSRRPPSSSRRARRNSYSAPFVSSVPTRTTEAPSLSTAYHTEVSRLASPDTSDQTAVRDANFRMSPNAGPCRWFYLARISSLTHNHLQIELFSLARQRRPCQVSGITDPQASARRSQRCLSP
jgi:hypothetical protein